MANRKHVDVAIPEMLLLELDSHWPKKYQSRTEAIRDAIRKLVIELRESE